MAKAVSALLATFLSQLRRSDAVVVRLGQQAARAAPASYTFSQFTRDFGREYAPGTEEYSLRLALFQKELVEVQEANVRNTREGRLWKAGVHPFMDWTPEERRKLNGYKPSRAQGHRPSQGFSLLHSGTRAFSHSNATRWRQVSDNDDQLDVTQGGMGIESGPQIRNQGSCGSCWAISAVEAVEAQLQRSGAAGSDVRLSAQGLVDCVPNPQHCGGSGGCDGATGELAYAFMRDHGIPLEGDLPYKARTGQCPQQPLAGAFPASQRVRVSGWNALPSNKAKPLMQALVSLGPTVVAVDGNNWFNYESGIFDGCDKDATIGHAVLAKGYGQDSGTGYWLIQNSWGSQWGEQGHIRLMRHADEDSWCGTDHSPKEGVGCDGGPPEVTVCGTCGVLYDSLVPEGVHMESGSESPALHAKNSELEMDALFK
jgi:cathepsin L